MPSFASNNQTFPACRLISRSFSTPPLASVFFVGLVFGWTVLAGASEFQTIERNGQTWTLPAGFEIELVAGPPLVDRPITADFDEMGRLYVSDSSGSNDKVEQQLKEKPHRILRLVDSDGDGRFDQRTVFADQMMFPEGTLWHDGSLYVAAPPSIWKLTDTDDDGVADKREEWFKGQTLTGCANDLHGPYLGRDGWIYWCKGAFAEQRYDRPGREPFVTRAAHIFRCRPDAPRDPETGAVATSAIEPVMTGGMDNPVDVAFTSGGERIFTTTFFVHPGGGQRDGLVHAIYGGVYGKVHGVLDGHIRTGDVMPVLAHLGAAAPCGLTSYDSGRFGEEFRGNLFACCFNMRKLTRHVLNDDAPGLTTTTEDFLTSSSIDFHPTDVVEDADGSLLVVDTGGWYKLCCPTSTLWKPDVLGGIYRIRRRESESPSKEWADPRGLKLDWNNASADDLAMRLGDPRPAVRRRAVEELAKLGEKAVPSLVEAISSKNSATRGEAVWALTRIDSPQSREAVRASLCDSDSTVRQAALNSISLRRDEDAASKLRTLLADESIGSRLAAEALGRIGDSDAVGPLLEAAASVSSREMRHAVIYALWKIGDVELLRRGLAHVSPQAQSAAAIALDQLANDQVAAKQVIEWLHSQETVVYETAQWLLGRHPEWGGALAQDFAARLSSVQTSEDAERLTEQLLLFSEHPAVQELLANTLTDVSQSMESRRLAVGVMGRAPLQILPPCWVEPLAQAINDPDSSLVANAVTAAKQAPLPEHDGERLKTSLRRIAEDDKFADEIRLDALAALRDGMGALTNDLFAFVVRQLAAEQTTHHRATALQALGHASLTGEQLASLAETFRSVGPLEASRLLEVFAKSQDDAVGRHLVLKLKSSPALTSLRVDALQRVLSNYGAEVQAEGETLAASINVNLAQQRQQLETMQGKLQQGDIRRGLQIFHSTKAACATCHQMGYVGGNVGPDLSQIGKIREERDLLEAILFPSASFVRSYEPVVVQLVDGRTESGILKDESAGEVVLVKNATEIVRIPRDDIEDLRPGDVSVMPAGFGQQLTEQDLADLTVFLKSLQ